MPGDDMAALARDMERAGRRIAELEGVVRKLVAGPPAPSEAEQAARVRSWLLVDDPETARGDLDDLTEWLDSVYLQYPHAALPSCWARHPSVVEELFQLRWLHDAAYRGRNASWARVADWHERYRPGVQKRVTAAISSCELSLHLPGSEAASPAPTAPLRASNQAVAATWTSERRAPIPTSAELREANAYEQAQNQSNH